MALVLLFRDIFTADKTAAGDEVDISKGEDVVEAKGLIVTGGGGAEDGPGTPSNDGLAVGFNFFVKGFTFLRFSAACFKPAL